MDLGAVTPVITALGPRIYMHVSSCCCTGTTFLCADTCPLLFKYYFTAVRMTRYFCGHATRLWVKCPAAAVKIPHKYYAGALILMRMYPKIDGSALLP
jgi:hypothetical protein